MKKLTFTSSLPTFTFNEEDENDGAVDNKDGYFCNFTLDRTFRTGGYNTFAVPFSVSLDVLEEVLGEGTVAKELTASAYNNGELSMTFTDAASIESGKPYFIKVPADVVNPTFMEVTVRNGSTTTTTDYVNVVPAIGKTLVKGADGSEDNAQSVLFLGGGNKFLHPTVINRPDDEDSYLNAYLQLHNGASLASRFKDNLDAESTSILDVQSPADYEADAVYDLNGRKVASPAVLRKGIYIRNGKKFVIK